MTDRDKQESSADTDDVTRETITGPEPSSDPDAAQPEPSADPIEAAAEAASEPDAEAAVADDPPDAAVPDAEPPDDADNVAAPPPAATEKPRRGGVLTFFVFLIAAAGLGLAGWLYYRIEYLGAVAAVDSRVNEVIADQAALRETAATLNREQAALGEQVTGFEAQMNDVSESTVEALNEALTRTPPTEKRWKLAEVEYLLRIANHRVVLEEDADAALQLLEAADAILTELDDFSLHDVRARLADEMLSLRTVRRPDLQGLFLRIEAIKSQLANLPLHLPEYLTPQTPEVTEDVTMLTALTEGFNTFFKTRTFEGRSKPLISPEEAVYLELNLRLTLERAGLAAMRGHQLVYEESLATAEEWMGEFLEADDDTIRVLVEELQSLQQVQLNQTLPDISGSLNRLVELKAQGRS